MVGGEDGSIDDTTHPQGSAVSQTSRDGLARAGIERRSNPSWRRGADGDPLLAAELEGCVGDDAIVLHGRIAPTARGTIDHLVVAASGVWIVDAKSYWGVAERRDVGNWRTVDHRLYVNGRDETAAVDNVTWQAAVVRATLDSIGCAEVPVHPVLLFVGSGGRWFVQPIEIRGVRAMWTKQLTELVSARGTIDAEARRSIAAQLDGALPTASS